MDPLSFPSLESGVCKWCGLHLAKISFENAKICYSCHTKALKVLQTSELCHSCNSLATNPTILEALFSEDGFVHSGKHSLKRSADDGCALCRLLLLQDPNPNWERSMDSLTLFAERTGRGVVGNEASGVGDINSLYFSSEQGMFTLKLSVSAAEDNPAAEFVSQRPVENNLGGENTIRQIRRWLDECLGSHPECQSNAGQLVITYHKKLPTRVVDVGTDSEPVLKLFQPSFHMQEPYITLSYCWGKQRFLTTVNSNLATHLECLPQSDLPQTFIDAIGITRDLGYRYLWIDALCIIQDSAEDKAVEINAMERIYSDSTLTIAVVSAKAVNEGFLRPKSRLKVDIPYLCPDGILGTVQVSPQDNADIWQEPLYTRAWCLQENLLSPRLLLFTNTEVIWQCENHPMRRPNTTHVVYSYENPQLGKSPFARLPLLFVSHSATTPDQNLAGSASSTEHDHEAARYKVWRNNAWSDEYYAGIWKRQFIPSLTWRRKESVHGPEAQYWPPLSEYRAPSWSWASIEGPIEFDYRFDLGNLRGLGATLISCEAIPLREEVPLREVRSGKAVLHVSLIAARDLPIRGHAGQDGESYRIGGLLTLDDHPREWCGRAHVLEDDLFEDAFAMLLGEGRDGSGKMTTTTALVLMPFVGEVNTYKRVGFWTSSIRGASKLWVGARNRKIITLV